MNRYTLTLAAAFALGATVAACAAFMGATSESAADAEAQVACSVDASSYAQGLACVCAVRRRYPAGPQCDASVDTGTDGAK